jgi:serine phosphatase RsbU (regulator of sigma subunit)
MPSGDTMGLRARACDELMSQEPDEEDAELRRLHSAVDARERNIREMGEFEQRQETLIARLRREVDVRDHEVAALRERLEAAEHELEDLRAIRDALTPPELPQRSGLELAAAFLPAAAEQVSGDFYLVAEGPQGFHRAGDRRCRRPRPAGGAACRVRPDGARRDRPLLR